MIKKNFRYGNEQYTVDDVTEDVSLRTSLCKYIEMKEATEKA